jgi:hypothetical protein
LSNCNWFNRTSNTRQHAVHTNSREDRSRLRGDIGTIVAEKVEQNTL